MLTNCRGFVSLLLFAATRLCGQSNDSPSAWTLAVPPFSRTSFDCAKARVLSVEEAICKNDSLAKLDVEVAEAYKEWLRLAAAPEREEVIASQRKWLTIRNAHNVNPYHGDPPGALADLSDFYKARIAALRSRDLALMKTEIPEEYAWLRAIAPEGFSKQEFFLGRAYAGCEDPCQKKPALYRWISIGGGGIGEEPGDIDTPYDQLAKKLASEGWAKCREASDSGKPLIEYFRKGKKIVTVSRSYSMGAGNGIGLAITVSDPLPQNPRKVPSNPAVVVSDDWNTYGSPDVGLKLRYPPKWGMRDDSPKNGGTSYKYLLFGAEHYKPGEFRVTVGPDQTANLGETGDAEGAKCFPSGYRISGLSAQECVFEDEVVSEGVCERHIHSFVIQTGKYDLTFEPSGGGSFADDSGHYTLLDLYEKIMSTIEIEHSNR
jgi:uncharacterized protein YecT (DUF1311 family)